MKTKPRKSLCIGGVKREYAMLAAGYCAGLSNRQEPVKLNQLDRRMLRMACSALAASCRELWPDWFKQ